MLQCTRRALGLVLLGALGLLASCKTTTTTSRSGFVDPQMENLEGSLKLLPTFDEEGISRDRSDFEGRSFSAGRAFDTASLDMRNYAAPEFSEGPKAFGTGDYAGLRQSEIAGGESSYQGRENADTGSEARVKKKSFLTKLFRTDGDSAAKRSFTTRAEPYAAKAQLRDTRPEVIGEAGGGNAMSIDEVRKLLNRR
ncbi:MAG: hypothetical protein ACC661_05825 [Verrucomicrobiales bacterium]